jgi:hypothetical protein
MIRVNEVVGTGTMESLGGVVTVRVPVRVDDEDGMQTLVLEMTEVHALAEILAVALDTAKVVPFDGADLQVKLEP